MDTIKTSDQNMIYPHSGTLFTIEMNTKEHGGTSKTMIHEMSQTQNVILFMLKSKRKKKLFLWKQKADQQLAGVEVRVGIDFE